MRVAELLDVLHLLAVVELPEEAGSDLKGAIHSGWTDNVDSQRGFRWGKKMMRPHQEG